MLKGLVNMDDNISNLTFASGDQLSASSSTRNEVSITTNNSNIINIYPNQLSSASTTIQSAPPPLPPSKKKRSLPGNPDPEAEVIALSPKTLLATNRFICEICNKGFQRDQNLQLHRRGHNLPWKLKQRSNKEIVKKKVYVCPESTCVHHDPSRALGDLTGIKKHFFRKHGEKKWKCDKCSKRYAVQSDWKAHSKICGTREYRCDCGTLFSRRDSFITHRAFCDALAQETTSNSNNISGRGINTTTSLNNMNPLVFSSSTSQLDTSTQMYGLNSLVKREQQDVNVVPPWLVSPSAVNLASPPPPLFSNNTATLEQSFGQKHNPTTATPTAFASATALLQKAAQMGATMSSNGQNRSSSFVNGGQILMADQYNDMMSSPFNGGGAVGGNGEGLTRDFLGLRTFPRREFFDMVGLNSNHHHLNPTPYGDAQTPWQG